MISAEFLGIAPGKVDLCMIDGDHNAATVYDDARLVFQLVRSGGWIMFDDVENGRAKTEHVKDGLTSFLQEYGDKVKLVVKDRYMEIYEKL